MLSKSPFHFQHLSDSPTIKNKENSLHYTPLISHTSLDHEHSISHKILNEVLNNGNDYISEQIEQINRKITQYQHNIKQKITSLLNESTSKSIDQSSLQKQLSDLRMEEQNYSQLQIDIDRQQSQVFDYYEQEFNKLKQSYESISQEHQNYLKDKQKTHDLYNQLLENKAILQEDLNARLLQRAELVGQKEELEEFVEQVKMENQDLFEIAQDLFLANKKIMDINLQIKGHQENIDSLGQQREDKKKQLGGFHQISLLEVQLHQSNQKLKLLKNKIVPIQKSLNLPHPDTLFNEFINQRSSEENQECRLQSFIQQFRNSLFRQGNQGSNWGSMKEFVNQLEQFIIASLQQKQTQSQYNESRSHLKQYGDESLLQNEVCTIEFSIEVKKQQIKELEEQGQFYLNNQEIIYTQFQERIDQLAQDAYLQYQEQNEEQLQEMEQEYGKQHVEEILQNTYDELVSLMAQSEQDLFNNTYKLIEKYSYQDQAIQTNIQMVDQQILPQLKGIVNQLQRLKKDIERLGQGEKPHQERLNRIEQEIQSLELEFKNKIQGFQSQEQDINQNLNIIKEQIEFTQEQLLSRIKPNKALLEQEILQMNNVLTSLVEQKNQLERDNSRKSSSGVLAISKSLNQFTRLRKQENVQNVSTFSNSVVKGITPTKEAANLYLISKYGGKNNQNSNSKKNLSLKNIK